MHLEDPAETAVVQYLAKTLGAAHRMSEGSFLLAV